jgi:hypothetical protein
VLHLYSNIFLLTRTLLGGLLYADWGYAYRHKGLLGILIEALRALTGFGTWPFFVDARSDWYKENTGSLLRRQGIPFWGWGYHNGTYFFRVRVRQAELAQAILLENKVPLRGRLLPPGALPLQPEAISPPPPVEKGNYIETSSYNI